MLDRISRLLDEHTDLVAVLTLLISVVPRIIEASFTYLNPDEASYFSMAVADTLPQIYQRSLETHHPPLFIFVLALAAKFSYSEIALRAVPIAAGAAFPWFVYRWLGLVWSRLAGYLALLILAFSPVLVSLSAEARGYTLALLGIAASLYFLERAVRESSPALMAAAAVGLYLAILTEYLTAFFAGGAGIYFLVRVWGRSPRPALVGSWIAVQAGGVALYALLYFAQIRQIADSASSVGAMEGFLQAGFLKPGENPLVFFLAAVAKQFVLLFGSASLGLAMLLPFLAGLRRLWRGPSKGDPQSTRAVILLSLAPFVLAGAGSFLRAYPFLRSRHTIVLGVFIAIVVAIFIEQLLRKRTWLVLPAAIVLIPLWLTSITWHPNTIPIERHGKTKILSAVEHLRSTLPAGSVILCDAETQYILDYYLGPGEQDWSQRLPDAHEWNNLFRLVAYRYMFIDGDQVNADMSRLRQEYNLGDEDIQLVDGGWLLHRFRSAPVRPFIEDEKEFGGAVTLFRMRPRPALTETEQ